LQCIVTAEVGRNTDNRLRVLNIHARLQLGVAAESLQQTERVMNQFEGYCTVTQSVGQGIPISVEVFDREGQRLK
jgi:uncharacterized OsmC-like protein